jgi:rare lipoprotein A (peptidoglycan hydrolase)
MMLRLATLLGLGLFGAVQATAEELSPLILHPPAHERSSEFGLASWYGSEFHGHSTANGEIFDMGSLSAAHRTMPLPSYARVTNLHNGRSVIVRVNDRGPFVGGRMLDVSARVANLLDFNRTGVTKVRLDYIGKAPPAGSDGPTLLASLQTNGVPTVVAKPTLVAAHPAPEAGVTTIARAFENSLADAPSPSALRFAPDEGETVIARAVEHTRAIELTPVVAHPAPGAGDTMVARAADERPAAQSPSPYGVLIAYPFIVQIAPLLRGTSSP